MVSVSLDKAVQQRNVVLVGGLPDIGLRLSEHRRRRGQRAFVINCRALARHGRLRPQREASSSREIWLCAL